MASDKRQQEMFKLRGMVSALVFDKWLEGQPDKEELLELIQQMDQADAKYESDKDDLTPSHESP